MIAIHAAHMLDKDLNLLQIFEALLAERNVSKAARRLHMSQPALSHALARLRRDLGDDLFVRVHRGVQPTPRALELAPVIAQALEGLRGVYQLPEDFDPAQAKGRFRIAGTELFEQMVFPRLVPELHRQAPGLVLVSRNALGRLPRDELERGDFDLAVGGMLGELPEGFYQQAVFDDDFVCIVRHDHPGVGKRLTLKTYLELDHCLITLTGDLVGVVDRALAKLGKERRVVAGISSFLTPGWVVARSDLALTAPRRLVSRYVAQLPVRVLELPFDLPRTRLNQVWHERTHRDPLHRWMRRMIVEAALDRPAARA